MNERKTTTLETIRKIYFMLEDEESRELYINRLVFSLTESRKYSMEVVRNYVENYHMVFSVKRMNKLWALLPEDRSFVLYGAGEDGRKLMTHFMHDKRFLGFCSETKEKQKDGYYGFPVLSPEELLARKDLSVIIATRNFRDEIMGILKNGGYPQELIFDGPAFYVPDVWGSESEQYFGPDFMKFQEEEVFVDAGCYDLGSSIALSKHCKRLKVYAFEPEAVNYKVCLEAAEKRDRERMPDVKIFPYGVWSEKTTLQFVSILEDTSSSHISMASREISSAPVINSVPVMPVDEAIDPGDRVTTIKMDVEGSELEALKGARRTIERDKPKLAICIYHKPEDLWEIPLYIKEIVPEYRLYIRHHSLEMYETVLYAVMPE